MNVISLNSHHINATIAFYLHAKCNYYKTLLFSANNSQLIENNIESNLKYILSLYEWLSGPIRG